MNILGISAFYHDSAAALLRDGEIVAAAQEERFTRRKHDANYPENAIAYCLREGGFTFSDIDHVAFYEKPLLKFERLISTYLAFAPAGFNTFSKSFPVWIRDKIFHKSMLAQQFASHEPNFDWASRLLFNEHHMSHAASAFYPSPFGEAAVLTMDGVGEWATTSVAHGKGADLEIIKEIHYPHSLGLLYSALTYYLGFKVNSGEYKVMGLAPYGSPDFSDVIRDSLIELREDGSFRLNMEYFDYCTGDRMISPKFAGLFGEPVRDPETLLTQKHMDIAASLQAVTEQAVSGLARAAVRETGVRNLCLAGGVALNCVANGKLLRDIGIDGVWVQPAAGDAGGALGAALSVHHQHLGKPRAKGTDHLGSNQRDSMRGAYLGPGYGQSDIETRLSAAGARFETLAEDRMIDITAAALVAGNAVGWFQGRMEFGPRALGNRSILGDPRSPSMQRLLNLKVKYRESFRPFAPAVLAEHVSDWFEIDQESPYMLIVADVVKRRRREMTPEEHALFGIDKLNVVRSEIPAVTHVDFSARVQTVHADTNSLFHKLLSAFHRETGCPILVNTSFNIRGEPIVESPEDAFRCFMGTEIELLVAGNCLLRKDDQDDALRQDYRGAFVD